MTRIPIGFSLYTEEGEQRVERDRVESEEFRV
jgi:hypothetical protein